jgi:hypothetical protein
MNYWVDWMQREQPVVIRWCLTEIGPHCQHEATLHVCVRGSKASWTDSNFVSRSLLKTCGGFVHSKYEKKIEKTL